MTPTSPESRPLALSCLPVDPTLASTLHSLLLCNTASEELGEDIKRLVDFMQKAYGQPLPNLAPAILEGIEKLGTFQDTEAYSNSIDYDFEPEETSLLDQLFVNAMGQIRKLTRTLGATFHAEWFDYSTRRVYDPAIRYNQLALSSVIGLPVLERAVGLCLALGIGVKADLNAAKARFRNCLFWGDGFSLRFLRELAKEEGSAEELAYYDDLLALWRYLDLGLTVVPQNESGRLEKAKEDFALIASIRQDIVLGEKRHTIDFSFLNVIFDEEILYADKLHFIDSYAKREWAGAAEARLNPNIGFGYTKLGGKKQ